LTDLVDVVSRSGTPKARKVATIKNRPPYQPQTDFYKPLREGIVAIHQQGGDKTALKALLGSLADKKKAANYPGAVDGYQKWWGKKTLEWFAPARAIHSHAGVDVAINPELGLIVEGHRMHIKLYLKADPLTKLRCDLVTALMESALRPKCQKGDGVGLLDVRKAKMFVPGGDVMQTTAMVDAELAYIAQLWASL